MKDKFILKKADWQFWCIIVLAVFSRVILINEFPAGLHADEAYSGYEAWSVLTYGYDSWGYTNPVYLNVWGGGMSVLNSLLMMPIIAVLGLNTFTLRISGAILGIISVFVFGKMLRLIFSADIAKWGMFLLAISPWHIMTSRYAMDANLAPGFLIMAFYFAVLGIEKKEKYLIVSALIWGLSLYTYAINWIFVPIFGLACVIYCIKFKKLFFSKYLVVSCIVLFVLALPLMIFVCVNIDIIPEIKTGIISIPRLVEFRADEISIKNFFGNIVKLIKLFIKQDDYLIWNSIKWFGIYYLYSTPFVVIGFVIALKNCIYKIKNNIFCYEFIVLVWFFIGIIIGLIQGVGINRMNCIHMSTFILLATGVSWVYQKLSNKLKISLIMLYLVSFVCFEGYYFTIYQEQIGERQFAGLEKAIDYALIKSEELNCDDICITSGIRHSQVLFSTKYPTNKYISEVEWKNYPNKQLQTQRFGKFVWEDIGEIENSICIILEKDINLYKDSGYYFKVFDKCAVAVPQG